MENNIIPNGNGEPMDPKTPGQERPGIRNRVTSGMHRFAEKHPKLVRAAKWTTRIGAGAGLFLLGRKSVKVRTVYIQPLPETTEEEPKPEEEENPEELPEETQEFD